MTFTPRQRLGIRLWCAGMTGVVTMTVLVLPRLLAVVPQLTGRKAPDIPLWVLLLASLVQSGLLLGVAVWGGCRLAADVGLHAPLFEGRRARWIAPGTIGGLLGGVLLIGFLSFAPAALRAAQARLEAPLAVRVLYGGFTEEILLRWGIMTLLAWLPWRFLGARRASWMWLAILLSSVAFGLGHLPAAALLIGGLTPLATLWVIGANTLFGVLFGFLYWRYGLESAMLAHALTHVLAYVAAASTP
jgi:membrane protease YdiL (CAAX protease family)